MLSTLKTLITGAGARAEETVRDAYAIELIDQKIREAEAGLKAAKHSLAVLIQRERAEARQIETLDARVADLTERASQALADEREDLAAHAAAAVAEIENETVVRRQTHRRVEARVMQLRQSVETANRRLVDLRQGAVAARAARREQAVQKRLGRHGPADTAFEEAEDLIARVLGADDAFEHVQIMTDIDAGLDRRDAADRLAEAGYGPATKSTAADVLARFKATPKTT